MPTLTYSLSISSGGITVQKSLSRTGTGSISVEESLPAGKAGTLTTRTDDDTGTITATAHGLSAGDNIDVFWSGGRRYSMKVSSVTDANIIVVGTVAGDIGVGDVLPAATTALVVTKQVVINVLIDGDALTNGHVTLSLETSDTTLTTKGHALFEDAAGDDIAAINLTANSPIVYDIAGGASNPFTGDIIVSAKCTNANSSTAATLKIVGVYDASP